MTNVITTCLDTVQSAKQKICAVSNVLITLILRSCFCDDYCLTLAFHTQGFSSQKKFPQQTTTHITQKSLHRTVTTLEYMLGFSSIKTSTKFFRNCLSIILSITCTLCISDIKFSLLKQPVLSLYEHNTREGANKTSPLHGY